MALWPPFVLDEGPGLVDAVSFCFDDNGRKDLEFGCMKEEAECV